MVEFYAYEWLAIAYYLYLIGTALAMPALPAHLRTRVSSLALLLIALIAILAVADASLTRAARSWLPLLYLVAGYWLPAQLVVRTNPAFEQTLMRLDRQWFGPRGLATFRERAPKNVVDAFELAYLACYPLVPLGFISLVAMRYAPADADRFWTTVLGAALPCYGTLPWLPSRPPRAIEIATHDASSSIRNLNVRVLRDVSVGWNTFPSGHAAASIATALAVGVHLPRVGLVFGGVAAGICIGSVVGRYHYAADAVAGALVAGLVFTLVHVILI
jgi:membrane-associated phospholipid phosphatase